MYFSYILSYYFAIFDEPEGTCFLATSLDGDPISSTTLTDSELPAYQLVNTTFKFPADGTEYANLVFSVECDEEGQTTIGLDDISLVHV